MLALVPLLVLLVVALVGAIVVRNAEYKEYNNGVCIRCGHKLAVFDNDSQGGTGWKCRKCGHHFWTSWVRYNISQVEKE